MNKEVYRGNYPPKDTNLIWIKGKEFYLFDGITGEWVAVNESTVVDQEFNPESTHAQSGQAINQVIEELPKYIETTWQELKDLRDNSQLIPGAWYRITDYECLTSQVNTRSAGHKFDILVQALDINVLGEECKAIQHEGDTYFKNCNLAAWKVWYSLDNNKDRFSWGGDMYEAKRIYTDDELWFDFYGTVEINGQLVYLWWNEEFSANYASSKGMLDGEIFYLCSNTKVLKNGDSLDVVEEEIPGSSEYIFYASNYSKIEEIEHDDVVVEKGLIYRLIDEHNNDCPYDFKNIQFKVCKINGSSYKYLEYFNYKYFHFKGDDAGPFTLTSNFKWFYTFSAVRGVWNQEEEHIEYDDVIEDDTEIYDYSIVNTDNFYEENNTTGCFNNKIDSIYEYTDDDASLLKFILPENVVVGWYTDISTLPENYEELCGDSIFSMCSACYGNLIKGSYNFLGFFCYDNTINGNCNTIAGGSHKIFSGINIISNYCTNINIKGGDSNYFGERCRNIYLDYKCTNNVFWGSNTDILMKESCQNNTFGSGSCYIEFESNCYSNILGTYISNDLLLATFQYCKFYNGSKKVTLSNGSSNVVYSYLHIMGSFTNQTQIAFDHEATANKSPQYAVRDRSGNPKVFYLVELNL